MADQIDVDAKIIAGDEYGFLHPTIVRHSNGDLFAGHINDSGYLEIHKSTDDGVNWTNIKTFTHASLIGFCLTINKTDGLLFVGYSRSGYKYMYKCVLSTVTWSTIFETAITWLYRMLIIYADGRLWQFYDKTVSGIFHNSSTDNGANWGSDTETGFSQAKNIRGVDYNSNTTQVDLIVISTNDLKMYKFNNSTGGYSAWETIFSGSESGTRDIDLVVDTVGNKWSIFRYRSGASGGDYCVVVYKNNGLSLTIFNNEATDPLITGGISIGIDGDDNVYAYYTKSSDEKLYYRKYDSLGASWGAETLFEATANNKVCCEKHSLVSDTFLHLVYYTA